jgi:hypothetical protein
VVMTLRSSQCTTLTPVTCMDHTPGFSKTARTEHSTAKAKDSELSAVANEATTCASTESCNLQHSISSAISSQQLIIAMEAYCCCQGSRMRKPQSSQRSLAMPIYLESMAEPDQAARHGLMLTAAGMRDSSSRHMRKASLV